jgi:hypothetical protein
MLRIHQQKKDINNQFTVQLLSFISFRSVQFRASFHQNGVPTELQQQEEKLPLFHNNIICILLPFMLTASVV